MGNQEFWRRVREVYEEFPVGLESVHTVSLRSAYNTQDIPGRISELPRNIAALRIAQGRARVATIDEIFQYKADLQCRTELVRASFVAHPFVPKLAGVEALDEHRWFVAVETAARASIRAHRKATAIVRLKVLIDRVLTRIRNAFNPHFDITKIRPGMSLEARNKAAKAMLAACQ